MGLDNGLSPIWHQAILSTNADSIHCRTYAAQGRDELTVLCEKAMGEPINIIHSEQLVDIVIRNPIA